MSGQPKKTCRKPSRSATCCSFEPGSVMAMKRRPASCRADELLDALEEILLEDVRLERRARFARDDEERVAQIDFALERSDLRRIGRIEHVQLREAGDLAERRPHHFGTEARSAHAQQQHMGEAGAPAPLRRYAVNRSDVRQLAVGDAEPAEPLRLVLAGPQRRRRGPRAVSPCPARAIRPANSSPRRRAARAASSVRRLILPGARLPCSASRPPSAASSNASDEELHALGEQLVGHVSSSRCRPRRAWPSCRRRRRCLR